MFSNSEPKTYSRFSEKNRTKRRRSTAGGNEDKSPGNRETKLVGVIIDNGAYTIKTGLSTDEKPRIIPNAIMKAKAERKRLFIGNQISECRDCSGLYYLLPYEKGYITKWDVQKPVWDYVFMKGLCPINEHPVILTQPLFNFKSIQDCIDEIFFEEYEVNSMFRVNPSDLAALKYMSDNKLPTDFTCLIVDTGYSFTHIIPYIKGKKFLNGIRRLNVGGKLLTNHLKDIISYRQYNVMEETYVINQVKEDTCYVAGEVKNELEKASKTKDIAINYVLPDFNTIRRGYIQDLKDANQKEIAENCQILRLNNERFVVPEILFYPSDIGMKSMGIAETIVKCIDLCPKDQQEFLANNIVLTGGNCNFPGFRDRVYSEVRSQLPHLWEVKVYQSEDPTSYNWKGGASLLKLPHFKSYLVSREEYNELGSNIIQQRYNTWMTDNSEEVDEPRKNAVEFSYLDKLRGKSIFGKQEPEVKSEGLSNQDNGTGTPNSLTDDPESLNVSEENSQDSCLTSTEFELKPKKSSNKNKANSALNILSNGDPSFEDLRNSVELFPFGTESYL